MASRQAGSTGMQQSYRWMAAVSCGCQMMSIQQQTDKLTTNWLARFAGRGIVLYNTVFPYKAHKKSAKRKASKQGHTEAGKAKQSKAKQTKVLGK